MIRTTPSALTVTESPKSSVGGTPLYVKGRLTFFVSHVMRVDFPNPRDPRRPFLLLLLLLVVPVELMCSSLVESPLEFPSLPILLLLIVFGTGSG
jgi:hypothetical protein